MNSSEEIRGFLSGLLTYFRGDGNDWLGGYRTGYCCTLLVFLLLLFFWLLIRLLFFRRRQVKVLSCGKENGSFQITAKAAADLIRSAMQQFQDFQLQKVMIFRAGHRKYRIVLNLDYRFPETTPEIPEQGILPELAGQVKNTVRECLSGILGLEAVEDIQIHITRAK